MLYLLRNIIIMLERNFPEMRKGTFKLHLTLLRMSLLGWDSLGRAGTRSCPGSPDVDRQRWCSGPRPRLSRGRGRHQCHTSRIRPHTRYTQSSNSERDSIMPWVVNYSIKIGSHKSLSSVSLSTKTGFHASNRRSLLFESIFREELHYAMRRKIQLQNRYTNL
jgi:hypothetical protein